MHKKQKQKKVKRLSDSAFCFLLLFCLFSAGWNLSTAAQAYTLRYHSSKQMSMEWSVTREAIWRVTSQTPEVPGTQLGPGPPVSLDGSKTPAATLPHGPEGKPAKMKKSAILGI